MRLLNRSLLFKLILAFWVVSISGIVIIAVLAGNVSQREFNRFVSETQYQSLVDGLSGYYSAHGSFTGAESLLEAARDQAKKGQAKEYLLIDPEGNILLSLTDRVPPGRPSPGLINIGFPIVVNDKIVARLIPIQSPRNPGDIANENLQRIYTNLIIGAACATGLALLLGWFMARNILRPLSELNAAAQSIAQGNLEKQVVVSARDEIGTLATSFNAMIASLKRSRDLRRQMTADIAHELRNPLSIILGNSEALSEGILPAKIETLEIIHDEARHLSRLVEDLRTLSLSEAGELSLQRSLVAPGEILKSVAVAYRTRAAEKGITIQTETAPNLPPVEADVERIVQVLSNLLDNSLKHTTEGDSVWLSAVYVSESVEISIRDNGSGIQPADLPFIFDRFYRSKHAPGRIQDGSGLGLAISRALVKLHKGEITVKSELGQGTTITIRLPVATD